MLKDMKFKGCLYFITPRILGFWKAPVHQTIRALIGGKVKLPCDVTPPDPSDRPYLVLLSRGATPIYSIDARTGQDLSSALHWKANPDSGIQESWFLKEKGFSGFLLQGLQETAEGDYFCRVDFDTSPTRNRRIKLQIIVPPHKIKILNELEEEVGKSVGPYPEGSSLRLECIVYGGKPPPDVTWWHEGSLIDGNSEERSGGVAVNVFTFTDITRENLFTTLSCHGNNSALAPPIKASVSVDMLFPPKNVKIKKGPVKFLQEAVQVSYTCDSEGSRPPAKITWWKNGFLLNDTKEMMIHEAHIARSVVTLVPTIEDDEAILTCRAQNPLLSPTSVVEDARKLFVHYAPRLRLVPGQMMNMSRVTEGDDVYLECLIEAQPKETWVNWYHEGQKLSNGKSNNGVIPNHKSLVLQKVRRDSSGNYTCEASNSVGSTHSNVLRLSVKFVPVCAKLQQFVYGGGNNQLVNVSCKVEAYPSPGGFSWAFNTSAEHVDIPKHLVQSEGSISVVSYTPLTHLDFGSLLCWAYNEIGEQKVPCVFQVVPASPPETPTNCSVWHEAGTAGEVVVACRPGWDGGLPQNFSLEVRVRGKNEVLAALRGQPIPHFTVTGLAPGAEYLLVVLASNSQGTAPPARIVHLTPIDIAEKRLSATAADGDENDTDIGSILAVVGGIIMAVILCFILLGIGVRLHIRNKRRRDAVDLTESSEQQQLEDLQVEHSASEKPVIKEVNKLKSPSNAGSKKRFSLEKLKRKHTGVKEELISHSGTPPDINSPNGPNLVGDSSPLIGSSSPFSSKDISSLSPVALPIASAMTAGCSKVKTSPESFKVMSMGEGVGGEIGGTIGGSMTRTVMSSLSDRNPHPLRHRGQSSTPATTSFNRHRGAIDNLRGLSRDAC